MLRERENSGSEFKKAIAMMKRGLDMICELSDEMEEQYSERDGYSSRGDYRDMDFRYGERRGSSRR